MDDLLRILAIVALVAGNAFFVIGEYAVVTARRAGLQPIADAGNAGARAALRLMDDPVRVISTVQVGITAIGILTGAIGQPLVADLLGDAVPDWLSFLIAFGVVTYLSVVFGELVPKALTLDRAERLAAVVARPIEWMALLLKPPVRVLQGSAALFLRPFGVRDVVAGESIRSADELRAIVDEAEGSGIIPRAQEEMLYNVFDFADHEVRDIMVPAHDVSWLDADLSADDALDRVVSDPHERYLVGRGSIDRLVGIAHIRDLVAESRAGEARTVGDAARPAYIVPETKDIGALLRELRAERQQLAVVIDEYGSTVGIASLEDVLEEIVGEIEDEYDLPDATLEWAGDRTVRVSGSMTIDDFNEAVGTDLPVGQVRTLAGLTLDALGRHAAPGDSTAVDGVHIDVEAVDGLRITKLRVTLPADAA